MANVGFKRGSQANFDKLTSYAEGVFYLTTDTNRLYVAQSSTKAELLNQGIKVYNYDDVFSTNSTVPKTEGQFYYLKDKNILCTYSNSEWKQINADTNTYEKITGISITKDKADSTTKTITYTIGIGTQEYDHNTAGKSNTHTQSLVIDANDLAAITSETAVGVIASNTTGGVILASDGVGSNSNSNVKIVGAGTASVSAASNTITITSNAAKLNAPAANSTAFTFEDGTGSGNVSVQFVGDGTVVASNKNDKGTIKFEHATSGVKAQEYKVSNSSSGNTTTINVPKFTVNSTGHITNASTEKVVLTDNNNTYSFGTNAITYEDNTLKIALSNQNSDGTSGDQSTATFDGLYFKANIKDVNGSTITSNEVTKYLQDNLGEFYTSNAVDKLIKDAAANMNAMTYKGVISNSNFGALTAASTNKGDTYKASDSFVITGTNVSVDAGDLLIYNGDDGTNKLANWDVVPSGDDIDTQYELQSISVSNGAQVSLYNKTNRGTDGSFQILGSNGVSASITNGTITVKHSNSITPNSSNAAISDHTLTVYDLTYDNQGHITGKTKNDLTLPDNNTTYTLSAGDNKIVLTDSNNTPNSVSISGDSYIKATADATNGIKVVHNPQSGVTAGTAVGSSKTSPGYSGSFNIPQVTVDAAGHVTALSSQAITLPAQQNITATSSFACASNKMTAGYTINGDGVTTASLKFGFSSSSLAISNTGSDNVCSIDLVWGTF